jgi:membrane protein implicated in regulation of membrane protease activity
MDWLRDHLWETWLGVAIVLGVAEMFSLDLFLVMLAVGALGGMVTALFTDAFWAQALVAAAVSVGMLAFVRPSLAKRLHGGPELTLGAAKLVGQRAVVTEEITGHGPGRIRLAGEIWTAAGHDTDEPIEPGQPVEVVEIRGATAYVRPVSPPELGR